MKYRASPPERFLACVLLSVMLPALAFIASVILCVAGKPIMVTEELTTADGATARRCRFRTTGHGSSFFLPLAAFFGDAPLTSFRK